MEARRPTPIVRYALSAGSVGGVLGLRLLLAPVLGEGAPLLPFVAAVLVSSWYGGWGPGLFATMLSAVIADFFFLPPAFTFGMLGPNQIAQELLFLFIGLAISGRNERLRATLERLRANSERLQDSQEQFRLLVDGVRDHALYMLDPEGRVVLWNRGAERILGYGAGEILGRSYALFYPPEEVARGAPEEHLAAAASDGAFEEEGRRLHKDGSPFLAHVQLTPLRDRQGNLRGFAKVIRDVTQRRRDEEEIRRLNTDLERRVEERTAQLEEANRALEAFTYSVSHDLRAPLRGVQGFAQALQEDYGDRLDETGREYAHRIVGAASRMEGLIQDLLAYSRLNRAQIVPQRVELAEAVEEARAQVLTGADLPVGLRVEEPLPAVCAHRATLVQVLANLLGNAVKFVPPGGLPEVRVRGEVRDGRVRLWVEDRGIGIAPEHQERIFKVFERLHGGEAYPGTGIGLAIVRKGMERMDGRAGVESEPGRGSRFWIELPGA